MEILKYFAFYIFYFCNIQDRVSGECLDGWMYFQGSCYLYGHTDLGFVEAEVKYKDDCFGELNVVNATRFCSHYQAYLANIETPSENNFIQSFLSDLKDPDHWIGLTDKTVDGKWRWQSNDALAFFTDWLPGQPNGNKHENCVVLASANNFKWRSYPCTHQISPLCEMPSNGGVAVG